MILSQLGPSFVGGLLFSGPGVPCRAPTPWLSGDRANGTPYFGPPREGRAFPCPSEKEEMPVPARNWYIIIAVVVIVVALASLLGLFGGGAPPATTTTTPPATGTTTPK